MSTLIFLNNMRLRSKADEITFSFDSREYVFRFVFKRTGFHDQTLSVAWDMTAPAAGVRWIDDRILVSADEMQYTWEPTGKTKRHPQDARDARDYAAFHSEYMGTWKTTAGGSPFFTQPATERAKEDVPFVSPNEEYMKHARRRIWQILDEAMHVPKALKTTVIDSVVDESGNALPHRPLPRLDAPESK